MINPMGKGILTFNNTVSIRGHERVNLLAAVFMIMYGPEHEDRFIGTSGKSALAQRNALYMENISPVVDRVNAIVEVMATYLDQSSYAKSTFDSLTDLSSSDEEYQKALEILKNREVNAVPEIEDVAVEAQEVVEEPVVEEVEEVVSEVAEESVVEEVTTEVKVEEEPEVEATDTVAETDTVQNYETGEAEVVEEKPVIPQYSEDLVIIDDASKYVQAIKGNITKEVREFKTMANAHTALGLCNKLLSLLPGEDLLSIVYNKDVVHTLYTEFEGAAYLLSSFRVLAIGIATGGIQNV